MEIAAGGEVFEKLYSTIINAGVPSAAAVYDIVPNVDAKKHRGMSVDEIIIHVFYGPESFGWGGKPISM